MARNQPLQVVAEPAKRERIIAIAAAENISQAQVVRDIIDEGLERREKLSARRVLSSR